MVRYFRSSVALCCLLVQTGCGGGPSTEAGQTNLVGPSVPLCGDGTDLGQKATDALLSASDHGSLVFTQQFNLAWFRAVSKASRAETVRFLRMQGVRVSKVLEGECDNYPSAPVVRGEDASLWERAMNMIPQGGVLLGLYPGREFLKGNQVVSADYALIVRRDSSRHTLLHEMGHYLLHRKRLDQGLGNAAFDRQLQTALRGVEQAKMQVQKNPSAENTLFLANQWQAAFPYLLEDQRRSHLEEAGIEDFISRGFVGQEIAYIPKEDALNNWYLKQNLSSADEFFRSRAAEIDRLLQMLGAHNDSRVPEAKANLQGVQKQIFDQLDQIQLVVAASEARAKKALTLQVGGSAQDFTHEHGPGCGRHYDESLQTPMF